MRLYFKCGGCIRSCNHEMSGTPDEHLERYLVCPDITTHEKRYQDPIMEKDKSDWFVVTGVKK